MGFEIRYVFHPRKEDGGYDTDKKEEKLVKVGKPFDDTPLEKAAAAIMAQLARRDVWVVEVGVSELVRKEISFKECKDGKGITLKNKRFSFNDAAQMISEDIVEETQLLEHIPAGVHPHEMITHRSQNLDELYTNPNKPAPIVRNNTPMAPVNQSRVLYRVIFDPAIIYVNEVKHLKFTPDRDYPVHQIVPHHTGKLDAQKIVVTDDTGRAVTVDEKYFTTAGMGLLADKQLNFSGSNGRGVRRPKLAFENEMFTDTPDPSVVSGMSTGIPVDDGSLPEDLLAVPDIRPGRSVR